MTESKERPEVLKGLKKQALEYLTSEVRDVSKATQLRINELTELVTAYAEGSISTSEYDKRRERYEVKWSFPIPGPISPEGKTDELIIKELNEYCDRKLEWERKRWTQHARKKGRTNPKSDSEPLR